MQLSVRAKRATEALWEQWPQEPAHYYNAFSLYLSLGTAHVRTVPLTALALKVTEHWLRKVCARWQWVTRAAAYDEHVMAQAVEQSRLARIDMSRRQASLGVALQSRAKEGLAALDLRSLDANAISNLALTGTKIERLARGESTENRAVQGGITIEWAGPRPKWAPQPGGSSEEQNFSEPAKAPALTSGKDADIPDAEVGE